MAAGVRRLSRPRTAPAPEFGPVHLKTANEFINKKTPGIAGGLFLFPLPAVRQSLCRGCLPDFFERPVQKLPTLSFFYK